MFASQGNNDLNDDELGMLEHILGSRGFPRSRLKELPQPSIGDFRAELAELTRAVHTAKSTRDNWDRGLRTVNQDRLPTVSAREIKHDTHNVSFHYTMLDEVDRETAAAAYDALRAKLAASPLLTGSEHPADARQPDYLETDGKTIMHGDYPAIFKSISSRHL